jgi:hypothetical protein
LTSCDGEIGAEVVAAGIETILFARDSVPGVERGAERSSGIACGRLREDAFESAFERGDENRVPGYAAAEADVGGAIGDRIT